MNTKNKLNICSKEKCYGRCDMAYIIVKYIKPLLQNLSNDIREYNMQLITTKCLNTAVMMLYFMLGQKGLVHSDHCDSRAVINRHSNGIDTNENILKDMKTSILRKKGKYRQLYYILMNDNYFPYLNDPNKPDAFFPGHVFILEKIPENYKKGKYSYNLYQSYINQYDLKGYLEKNDYTFKMNFNQVENLLDKITYILNANYWDNKCIKYWNDFTKVDTSNIYGSNHRGKLFICCAKARIDKCIDNIKKYTKSKLDRLILLDPKYDNDIYGNKDFYSGRVDALTNKQMKEELKNILFDIKKNK